MLHGASDGATFAEKIRAAALENYGTAGPAWLEYLTAHRAEATRFLRECSRELLDAWLERATDAGQVARVAGRFALVAAAGELATRAGITGWPAGEAERAARRLLDDWIAARGTRGDAEALAAVRQVAALLGQHAESISPGGIARPTITDRMRRSAGDCAGSSAGATRRSKPNSNATSPIDDGHAKAFTAEFHVLASAFRDEICRGFDPRYVARVLARARLSGTRKGRQATRPQGAVAGNRAGALLRHQAGNLRR